MRHLTPLLAVLLLACAPAPSPQTPTPIPSPSSSSSPVAESEPSPTSVPPPADAPALSPSACPAASAHVYHPARLHLLAGCRESTVRGVVQSVKSEPDGDVHIRLLVDATSLDPKGGHWTNAENASQQHGFLVLEPVCERTVTQPDAVAACAGYHNPLPILRPPSHVEVTGFWVFDDQHGWTEIHPVTKMERIP